MHPSIVVDSRSREASKENLPFGIVDVESVGRKRTKDGAYKSRRIKHSSSLLSISNFVSTRKGGGSPPIISQPVLNESSHEKLRNKVRHSPSMLSINGFNGQAELNTDTERRLIQTFKEKSKSGRIETSFDLNEMRSRFSADDLKTFKAVDLSHCDVAEHTLQSIEIHDLLSLSRETPGFVNFDTIHVAPLDSEVGQLYCILERPKTGKSLEEFSFEHPHEAVEILMMVAAILAKAEAKYQFEHRKLHAGNIMVDRSPENGRISSVNIVDCDLARIVDNRGARPKVLYTPLDHPDFYQPRLPILAEMRQVVHDPASFVPLTNVLWLRYLARYLYARCPSSELKRLEETLTSRWGIRKQPKSAADAFEKFRKKARTDFMFA